MFKCRLIVAAGTITGSQRTVCTCYLVDIAVLLEYQQRLFCQPRGQFLFTDAIGVEQFHAWCVVSHKLLAAVSIGQMFCQCLQGISREIGIIVAYCYLEAAHQVVILLLVDFLLRSFSDDTACTDVVEIVQKLWRVKLYVVWHLVQGIDALLLEAYIIIIGGTDNGQFALCIEQAPTLTLLKHVTFLVDTFQRLHSPLTVIVELTVL